MLGEYIAVTRPGTVIGTKLNVGNSMGVVANYFGKKKGQSYRKIIQDLRERERERDRQTDRDRDRDRERGNGERDRQTETDRQRGREIETETERKIERRGGREKTSCY